MIKILCIGNSFGSDCTRYLHGVARADGKDIKVVNLYIGGCSLYRHYRNMLSDAPEYNFEINGFRTDLMVSLKQGLLMDEWTHIFTQQCSPDSGEPETYEPYATELAAFIRKCNPGCRFWVHQTWTFETDAPRFKLTSFAVPYSHFESIKKNYLAMAERTGACGIIPDGEAMFTLWKNREEFGIEKVHRDGFHADLGIGRYLLALTVWGTLSGRDVRNNAFADFDVDVDPEKAEICRRVAADVIAKYSETNRRLAENAK